MKKAFLLLFCLVSLAAWSQKPEFSLLFEGIGDNREFSSKRNISQTILGARGAFELGTNIDQHRFRFGISHLFEFGSTIDGQKPLLILYYHLEKPNTSFHFGSFPRRGLINFPLAMLSDTLMYYRPNIEGLMGEIRWDIGFQNAWVDWTGRQAIGVREAFTAATSGTIRWERFRIQNYILLNHLAHSANRTPYEHVNDNLGYSIQFGYHFSETENLALHFQAGILGSVFRERSVTDGFINSESLLAEAFFRYRSFAFRNVLHTGEGHTFLSGDPFYRLDNYNRTDIVWYFIRHHNVIGRFNLSFHLIDGKHLDQSQQISIVYQIPAIP